MTTALDIIERFALERHPEGGWYKQTFEDTVPGARAHSTAIFYLLGAGERSHWHRVDAAEVWHYYAGAPLHLAISPDGKSHEAFTLGPDLAENQCPQIVVPAGHWQSAESTGDWTLVGCTVSPGFRFEGFEMAPADWTPG